MRCVPGQLRHRGHDLGRIDMRVRHVVVGHGRLQVERFANAWNPEYALDVRAQHRTVFDAVCRAFEQRQIDRVVPDEACEKDQVGLGNAIAQQERPVR